MTSIADHFKVTRPAISKHVKILEECGLVSITQQGRERYYPRASMNKWDEVSDWVERLYREMWNERLDRLEDYLKELQSKEKEHGNKK